MEKIYFKRDELNHTGAHKINNCIRQVLLARRMGKKRIVAETGRTAWSSYGSNLCYLTLNASCIWEKLILNVKLQMFLR